MKSVWCIYISCMNTKKKKKNNYNIRATGFGGKQDPKSLNYALLDLDKEWHHTDFNHGEFHYSINCTYNPSPSVVIGKMDTSYDSFSVF